MAEIKRPKRVRRQRISEAIIRPEEIIFVPPVSTMDTMDMEVTTGTTDTDSTAKTSTRSKTKSKAKSTSDTPDDEKKTSPRDDNSSVIDISKRKGLLESIETRHQLTLHKGSDKFNLEIMSKIGEGGFGAVYKCRSEDGQLYALKKIVTRGRGIPCLMEASVSMSYDHPYINKSILINATSEGIYILQDMAKCDMHNWRKTNKPSENQIMNVFYKVALAVAYFHKQGIVHGDVKPSNILYFNEDDIRITDFNLTTYARWKSDIHLCTSTYRPYELWNRKKWTEKIDIWSLGCTMFEIIYNKGLIPWQGNDKLSRKRYMNCILEWGEFNSKDRPAKKYPVEYKSPRIPHMLKHGRDSETPLMKLVLKCLQIHPDDRPNIQSILDDSYFDTVRLRHNIKVPVVTLGMGTDKIFYNRIKSELSSFVGENEEMLLEAATNICCEFAKKSMYYDFLTKKVSVWIAKKLIRTDVGSQAIPNADKSLNDDDILRTEIVICDALGFKLH